MLAEDVGDTPLELLQPVLLRCNAEQLASIEDGTRRGLLITASALYCDYTHAQLTSCLCTGMEEESCMRRCNHTGTEYTQLILETGTMHLFRSATERRR